MRFGLYSNGITFHKLMSGVAERRVTFTHLWCGLLGDAAFTYIVLFHSQTDGGDGSARQCGPD